MELNNVVIEVLDKEHGKKVINFFKSKGIDTLGLSGQENKKDNCIFRYYGIIDNYFGNYALITINDYNAKIVTLEELMKPTNPYPKVMWVSDYPDFIDNVKRVVFMEKKGKYIAWTTAKTLEESKDCCNARGWTYAKDIEPEVSPIKELTMQEIADKFQIPVDNLRIKKQ